MRENFSSSFKRLPEEELKEKIERFEARNRKPEEKKLTNDKGGRIAGRKKELLLKTFVDAQVGTLIDVRDVDFILASPDKKDRKKSSKKFAGLSLAALGVVALSYCYKVVRDRQLDDYVPSYNYSAGLLNKNELRNETPEAEKGHSSLAVSRERKPEEVVKKDNLRASVFEETKSVLPELEVHPSGVDTESNKEVIDRDGKTISEKLSNISSGRVELDQKTIEASENYWRAYYNRPEVEREFEGAYLRLKKWDPELKKIFEESGVPPKFRFLAIAESWARPNAKSERGARGLYQLTRKTGEKCGLKNWRDPIENARACAKHLSYLFKRTKSWELTLAEYNGRPAQDYINGCGRDEKPSFGGFFEYAEDRINNLMASPDKININKLREIFREHLNYVPRSMAAIKKAERREAQESMLARADFKSNTAE